MAYTSGTKAVLGEALSWVAAGALCVAMLVYLDDLRTVSGWMLGLPPAGEAGSEGAADANSNSMAPGVVEIPAGDSGHYHAEAEINGRAVPVLVDTGATMVALTYEDAERAGLYLSSGDFTQRVATANGTARVAPVTLDRVSIGPITVRNVQGTVSERGRLTTTLLGMSFLSRLERVDMRSGVLLLED